jgi:flagellar hook-basal body complex protein FliE
MSISGIESIAGALPAMPTTPATDFVNDAQNVAASGGGASGISGLGAIGGTDATAGTQGVTGASSGSGAEFGNLLSQGIDQLENLQNSSSNLSVQAATGDLDAIHDYTIAAAEASTATQLTVSLRNTALQSFNSIMNMSV